MKCKICAQKVKEFEDIQLQKTFYHCENCELIFLDKNFYITSEKEKSQYDNHNNSIEDTGYVQMFENFLDFFWEEVNATTEEVLDFGSGPGPVLSTLIKRRGKKCDIYDKFFQPKKVYQDKKYHLITSTEVFEHLEDPKSMLEFFKTILHSGGYVALMTLFHTNEKEDFLKWWYRRDPTHITFFRPKSFEILASQCGFKVIKTDNKRIILLQLM